MILTVTPNPCVDKTYCVDGFEVDRVNRPQQTFTGAGGKGINVARVYQTLGGQAIVTGFLGGSNGWIVTRALAREHIKNECVSVAGETRLCIAIIDSRTGTQTEINERGAVGKDNISELLRRVERLLSQMPFRFVVLSGSLPPDAPDTMYADLIGICRKKGIRAALDTSGAALKQGLLACPWMVKPNQTELETALNISLDSPQSAIDAAQYLHNEYNVAVVALTRGAEGAVLTARGETWLAVPPSIEFASAVASGDSFLAAFLWAWSHGERPGDPEYALQLAVGAGAANAAVIGAGFCTREQILTQTERVEVCRHAGFYR